MNAADTVRQLYRQYYADADAAVRACGPADGLFGIGKKAADAPCHTAFIESLKAALEAFREQAPGSAEVRQVLSLIYEAPDTHREPVSAYWMLIAAHGLTAELIPCLQAPDAAALYEDYDRRYPRRVRFPVQRQIMRALKKAAETA